MERKKMWGFILRWWIISVSFLFVFWLIWYLFANSVPVFSQIKFDFAYKTINLPFAISRWWDILIVFVWPLAYFLTEAKGDKINERFNLFLWDDLVVGSIVGGLIIIGGVCLNLWFFKGYIIPLFIAFFAMLVIEIIFECSVVWNNSSYDLNGNWKRLTTKLKTMTLMNLFFSFSVGLPVIFSAGLVVGFFVSIITFVVISLLQYLVIYPARGLYYSIKYLFIGIKEFAKGNLLTFVKTKAFAKAK